MRDREPLRESMWFWAVALVLVFGALLAGTYLYQHRGAEADAGAPPSQPLAASPAPAGAPPGGPVAPPSARVAPEPEPPPEPLPPLDESDEEVLGFLSVFLGEEAARFVVPERIVRNAVVTIDNLAREKVAPQQRPIRPTPGELLVEGSDEAPVLSGQNFARYEPVVRLFTAADTKTMVALYRRLYPLFRQAYDDLGLSGSFNTRLLEVIEHLLATPEVEGPIRLERPGVLYKYADPALEALTPGQKLLIRMGPDNARAVKQKLREIRDELV
ncbi:MAG TPA: DUF3014 domain-containing protein [Gammaproteobacteria bacterium]